jgi:hypothetical protein
MRIETEQKQEEKLPQRWWYEDVLSMLSCRWLEIMKKYHILKVKPTTEEEFCDKLLVTDGDRMIIGMLTLKIQNGCYVTNCYKGLDDLELVLDSDDMQNFYPKLPLAKWSERWAKELLAKTLEEHPDYKFDFDTEFFPLEAEQSMKPEAVEFRKRRGFNWKWKEESRFLP